MNNIPEGATHVAKTNDKMFYKIERDHVYCFSIEYPDQGWSSSFVNISEVGLCLLPIKRATSFYDQMTECRRCGGLFDPQMHGECPCLKDVYGVKEQDPNPRGQGRTITSLVMDDLIQRTEKGINTYGQALRANNGRDALVDAYQEALDLAMYLRQAIAEQEESK